MWFYVFVFLLQNVNSANILFLNEVPSPSHHIWNYALATGLIQKGHNVTMFGPDADKAPGTNKYHHIVIEEMYDFLSKDMNYSMADNRLKGAVEMIKSFIDFSSLTCEFVLNSSAMKQLLNYPESFKFDMIIIDITMGPCLYPLIHKFNYPPTIGVTAFLLPSYISFNYGNGVYPSYLPCDWANLPFSDDMTFFQRTQNFIYTYLDIFLQHFYFYPKVKQVQRKIFSSDMESLENLQQHISLVLSNVDPILSYPQPITPNIIPVGGLHIRPPKKLPEDLQNFMDKSKRGMIIFSLGTNIASSDLGAEKIQIILETFKKLPYDFLWKLDSELKAVPKNIKLSPWLPLNDLLAHQNTKLFISHGGALSTQEAMYHGVPVLGMPFFADQLTNIQSMVNRNLADQIDFLTLTTDDFRKKIKDTVENHGIAKNMKEISARFRTLPETPLNRAVFWVEYVLQHKGAKFLSPKSRSLPYFVAASLDVVLFLSLIGVGLSIMFWLVIAAVCRWKSKLKTD